jgi:hypothetical protein
MDARTKLLEPRFENTLPGVGERRHLERARIRADVYILPEDRRHPPRWAETEDVSRRGVFIATPRGYALNTNLALTLCTAHGELQVRGKVVHLLEGIGFGCAFIDLTEGQRVALSYLVSLSRSAPPAGGTVH